MIEMTCKEVLFEFGIIGNKIEELTSGSTNTIWKVYSEKKQYVLKKVLKENVSSNYIEFQEWLQNVLTEYDYPYIPLLINRTGETIVSKEDAYWMLRDFSEGRCLDLEKKTDLVQAVNKLTELHLIKMNSTNSYQVADFFYWRKEGLNKLKIVREYLKIYFTAEKCKEMYAEYHNILELILTNKDRELLYPSNIVHGDFHGGNILFVNDCLNAIIDWDTARIEPRVVDYAKARLLLCRERHGDFQVSRYKYHMFEEEYAKKIVLSEREIKIADLILLVNYLPKPEYLKTFRTNHNKRKWYLEWGYNAIRNIRGM